MNNHLFLSMRLRDENKMEAVFKASIKTINEIGFVASSVAKIAKEARVSPATIYIYYKCKEDLLVSIYTTLKKKLSQAMLVGFDPNIAIKKVLRKVWFNAFDFFEKHPDYFMFMEQFSNSPYIDKVDHDELEQNFQQIIQIMQRGIDQEIIKDVPFELLMTFAFYPVLTLSNTRLCKEIQLTDENKSLAFDLAWDAIKC